MQDAWEPLNEGRYANYFQFGCNDREAIFDFGQGFEGGEPRMHTRIIISAPFLEPFLKLIQKSMAERSGAPENSSPQSTTEGPE